MVRLVVEVIVKEVLGRVCLKGAVVYLIRKAVSLIRQAVGKSVGTTYTVITP